MANDNRKDFGIINVKFLATKSRIPYFKLNNCIRGSYNSLSDQDKAKLFNTIQEEVSKACAYLGYSYEGRPIKPKGQDR